MCSEVTYKYSCGHAATTIYPCYRCVKQPEESNKACRVITEIFETKVGHGCHDCERTWRREWRQRHGIRQPLPNRANGGVQTRPPNALARPDRSSRRGLRAFDPPAFAAGRPVRGGIRPLESDQLSNIGVPVMVEGLNIQLGPSQVFRLLGP